MAPTPMMQQYEAAKAACPDAILLFRMGDFYELFHDDAKTAARVLGLALTSRDKGTGGTPMAGFPYHQLDSYLGKLIAAGFRAAICDQVEDPKLAKGLVRREVTRIVTPGTVTDDALLDPRESNFLAAVAGGDPAGVAWVELSTGRFQAATIAAGTLVDHLALLQPAECLIDENAASLPAHASDGMVMTKRPPWVFSLDGAERALSDHFQTADLEGFGFTAGDVPAIRAAGAILDYLAETQKQSLAHIDRITPYRADHTVQLDEATRRSLEITRTLSDGRREGSMLASLDRTATPMGSRLLADWIANPLTCIDAIDARLDAVEELSADTNALDALRDELRSAYDLERLLARVTTGRCSPRDLSFIGRTLGRLPALKARLTARRSRLLAQMEADLDLCPDLRQQLDAALLDECPLAATEGGLVRDGYCPQLDELRELARGGKKWIAQYQAEQVATSGIPSLKVGYNKVFGYYLEVTNSHRDKVPEHFIRKQTLKNAERYITPELKEYEERVVSADEKARQREYDLFLELREAVGAAAPRLMQAAAIIAQSDVIAALARLARERNYCRPRLVSEPILEIRQGRHPVLDVVEPDGTFVPNDTTAGNPEAQILLITGPNMAGKSTYIRQVALITLLAQSGSFVPAESATIGIADRIFARVGASDQLARGRSTFMVEMTETARILNTATERSLVILDEIGRGTSTYDGLSLAWAIVEHMHDRIGCRTLFATHYHELTDLASDLAGVKNLNVAVREWNDEVVFLHQIVDGAADKSYGIHVARLAGVPREVNERAKEILARLEDEHLDASGRPKIARRSDPPHNTPVQLTLFGTAEHPILQKLREMNLDETTPLDALMQIKAWREEILPDANPRAPCVRESNHGGARHEIAAGKPFHPR